MSDSKPKFDPNKPFDVAKPKFDPNKPFDSGESDIKPQAAGFWGDDQLKTVIDKSVEGMTGGWNDEISGAVSGLGRAAGIKNLGGRFNQMGLEEDGPTIDWDKIKQAYEQTRNNERKISHQESSDHPALSLGSNLVGGFVSPISKIMPAGSSGLASGAMMGGLGAAGLSEADNVGDFAKDTAIGTVLGGGVGYVADKAAPYIKSGIEKASGKLSDFAERRAFKALGPYQRDAVKAFDRDSVNKIGRAALDEGVVGGMPTSYEGLAERAEAAATNKGKQIGSYLDDLAGSERELQAKASSLPGFKAGIDRQAIAQSLREDLINANTDIPGIAAKNAKVESLIKEFEGGDDQLLSLLKSEGLKKSVGNEIKWDRLPGADIPIEEQVQRKLYTKLKSGVEDYADVLDKTVGGPSASGFRDLKDSYGALQTASDIASKRAAKESANRMISPSDYGTGIVSSAAGLAALGPVGAIAGPVLGGANYLGRKFGNQVMATGADAISQALLKSPRMVQLYQSSPQAFQTLVNQLEQKSGAPSSQGVQQIIPRAAERQPDSTQNFNESHDPQALIQKVQGTQYAKVLQNAAAKGNGSFAAAHYVLANRDPQYRKTIGNGEQ